MNWLCTALQVRLKPPYNTIASEAVDGYLRDLLINHLAADELINHLAADDFFCYHPIGKEIIFYIRYLHLAQNLFIFSYLLFCGDFFLWY